MTSTTVDFAEDEEGDVRLSYFSMDDSSAEARRDMGEPSSSTRHARESTSPRRTDERGVAAAPAFAFLRALLAGQHTNMGEVNLSRASNDDNDEDEGYVSSEEMRMAFEAIVSRGGAGGGGTLQDEDDADNAANADRSNIHPLPTENERHQIRRLYFASYSFPSLPSPSLITAYPMLRHVDIRDNPALECIGALVNQLPHLESLNVCDCVNLRSLLPIADMGSEGMGEGGTVDAAMGTQEGMVGEAREDIWASSSAAPRPRRRLSLRHLWVRGCDLSSQTESEWHSIFSALSASTGPMERLALSRNNMSFLPRSVALLGDTLTYLFVDDCPGMVLPQGDVLGRMKQLRYLSLAGCDLRRLPEAAGRLPQTCDLNLHRNPNLGYPPPEHAKTVEDIGWFFHQQRMKVWWGMVRFHPAVARARMRANERLYRPGGRGYTEARERFVRGQEDEKKRWRERRMSLETEGSETEGMSAEVERPAAVVGGRTHRLSCHTKASPSHVLIDCDIDGDDEDVEKVEEHRGKRTRRRSAS